jgi:hypothetical protein
MYVFEASEFAESNSHFQRTYNAITNKSIIRTNPTEFEFRIIRFVNKNLIFFYEIF